MTTIGSVPLALVLEPVDLDEVWRETGARAQTAKRMGNLLGGTHQNVGQIDR
jgi:hypothetical protein